MNRNMSTIVCIILCLTLFLGTPSSDAGIFQEVIQQDQGISFADDGIDSWLPGWKYRKTHNITGAAEAGEDYQIFFNVSYSSGDDSGNNVYCGGNCSTDFSDIRFTGRDQHTVFDYWIESMNASDYANIWVKIAENLSTSTTVYMYYGNEYAASMSDGEATCDFFEDFMAPINTTKWNHTGPNPTFIDGNASFNVPAGKTWDYPAIATPDELPTRGYRLRTRMRFSTVSNFLGRYSYFGFGHSNIGTYGVNGIVCIDIEDSDAHLQLHSVGDETFDFHGTLGDVHTDFRTYEMLVQPLGPVSLTDGITSVSGTLSYDISLRPSIGIHVNGVYDAEQISTYYDYFWITKWQPSEPHHDEWGNATQSPFISDVTAPIIDSPQDMNIEAGTWNTSIQWNVTEENQYRYFIFVNNETVVSSDWNSTAIVFSLNSIVSSLGSYNVTLLLVDYNLNTATDTITVVVIDTTAPLIDSPFDMQVVEGDWNARIIWTIYEALPNSYTVTRDSAVIMSGSLQSTQVFVSLQTLEIGEYSFTLDVTDTSGHNASDTVIVTVGSPLITTTSSEAPDSPGWSNISIPILDMGTVLLLGFGFFIILAACVLFRSSRYEDTGYEYSYYQ